MGAKEGRGPTLESLARTLHWEMENLDPTESPDCDALTDRERDFYRRCVRVILSELEYEPQA